MLKRLINNKKQFSYIFKMLLITIFIAIEVFTGAKNMKEVDSTIENVIYQNLIQEDKNNKIKLKNFGAITDYEYGSIKSKKNNLNILNKKGNL